MSKVYPNIGSIGRADRRKYCRAHNGVRATKRLDIQIAHMRGDDYVFYLCDECAEDLQSIEPGPELNKYVQLLK